MFRRRSRVLERWECDFVGFGPWASLAVDGIRASTLCLESDAVCYRSGTTPSSLGILRIFLISIFRICLVGISRHDSQSWYVSPIVRYVVGREKRWSVTCWWPDARTAPFTCMIPKSDTRGFSSEFFRTHPSHRRYTSIYIVRSTNSST